MFIKKNVISVVFCFFTVVICNSGFAQEAVSIENGVKLAPGAKEADTSVVEDVEVKKDGAKAAYNAMELVRVITGEVGNGPSAMTITSDGLLYVVTAGERIFVHSTEDGQKLGEIGGPVKKQVVSGEDEGGKEKIEFARLMSVGSDSKGNIYAADYKVGKVFVINSKGALLFTIKLNPANQKKKAGAAPCGVAVNSMGDIYIIDIDNGLVDIYNMNGQYKYAIQSFKTKSGEKLGLARPGTVVINSKDEVYITDSLVFKVHRFNAKGNYLGSFGSQGDVAGAFVNIAGIAIDNMDRVYLLDSVRGIVQVFSPKGEFLYALSNANGEPLPIPMAARITVDKKNNYLYVAQVLGVDHVSVFKYVVAGVKSIGARDKK